MHMWCLAHVKVFLRCRGWTEITLGSFFSWVNINLVQRPLAVPGPDYKVQGWFFIGKSSVCASLAGVTVVGSAHMH